MTHLRRENDTLRDYVRSLEDTVCDQKLEMLMADDDAACCSGSSAVVCCHPCHDDEDCTITISFDDESLVQRERRRRQQLMRQIEILESEVRFREDMLRYQRKRERERRHLPSIDVIVDKKLSGCSEYILRMTRDFHRKLHIGCCDLDNLEREVELLVQYARSQPEIVLEIGDEPRRGRCKERVSTIRIGSSSPTFVETCLRGGSRGISVSPTRGTSCDSVVSIDVTGREDDGTQNNVSCLVDGTKYEINL